MKVVTVGTSKITSTCINAMKEAGIEVFACVGRDTSRVQQFADKENILLYSNDYDRVVKSQDFDTVYIATPNATHFSYAKKALENHKNVIVEKPMCSNFFEASTLVKIALANHQFIFENNKVTHNSAFKEILSDVNVLGNLKMAEFNFSKTSSRYEMFKKGEAQNMFSLEMSSGALLDLNIYNVSAAIGMFGMPKESLYLCNKLNGVDTSGIALLKYPTFIVSCISCKDADSRNYVSISGEKGTIYSEDHISTLNYYDLSLDGINQRKDFYIANHFLRSFKDFHFIVDSDNKILYEYYLKQSLMTMKVLDDLRKSANIVYPADKK